MDLDSGYDTFGQYKLTDLSTVLNSKMEWDQLRLLNKCLITYTSFQSSHMEWNMTVFVYMILFDSRLQSFKMRLIIWR